MLQSLLVIVSGLWAKAALAMTVQAPVTTQGLTLPEPYVACGSAPEGWSFEAGRRRLKPQGALRIGQATTLNVAPSLAECANGRRQEATLLVTGELPSFDLAQVVLFVDAGRLEVRGQHLEGATIQWRSGPAGGSDLCLNVSKQGDKENCAIRVSRDLSADLQAISLRWAPAGGRVGDDVFTYDRAGRLLAPNETTLSIGRVVISRLFRPARTVDVATGQGRIELVRPEAVSSVQCEGGHCTLVDHVLVDTVSAHATSVVVRAKLQPRVFFSKDDGLVDSVSESFTVVRCPMTIVSGQPLRGADDLRVLVKLDPICGKDVDRLRWTANGDMIDVDRVEPAEDGFYVLLRTGRTARDRMTIAALRREDGSVVALATERTREPPQVDTTLVLPGFGPIDFIPKNRDARVTVSAAGGAEELVPIAVPGAYEVRKDAEGYLVRGVYASGGYTALRFGYRSETMPGEFADTILGQLSDPVQRPIREANIPAPIGASSVSEHPIVEFFCRNGDGREQFIVPGTAPHIPFSERDSCRLVIHRERIPPESGEQRLNLDVSVTAAGGAERPEGRLSQRLVLRHGPYQDVIWIRGAKAQFDRINVRVTHVIDEALFMKPGGAQLELPSAQWSVVTENANFKFYATATIPANLFRFSQDPGDLGTGPLALNFGVLSRLTWLDSDGREGIVGLEAGVMGMGLATDRERHLALVSGLGISIPLGNMNQPTQAAVNIHAWVAYSLGERFGTLVDDAGNRSQVKLNPWAFIFGPSITIGSVGVFL